MEENVKRVRISQESPSQNAMDGEDSCFVQTELLEICEALASQENIDASLKRLEEFAKRHPNELMPCIIESNILDVLLELLNNQQLLRSSLSCLAAVTAGDDEISSHLLERNFLERALELCSDQALLSPLLCTLANIAAAYPGAFAPVVSRIYSIVDNAGDHLRHATRLLMALAGEIPSNDMFERLLHLSASTNEDISRMACFGLHRLLQASPSLTSNPLVAARALSCLQSDFPPTKLAGCNLVLDLMRNSHQIIDLPAILTILDSPNAEIQRVMLLCLKEHITRNPDPSSIEPILAHIADSPFKVKDECVKLLADLLINSPSSLASSIQFPIVAFFVSTLDTTNAPTTRLVHRSLARLVRDASPDDFDRLLSLIRDTPILTDATHDSLHLLHLIRERHPSDF